MIERINFIEKDPFSFSYKRLMQVGAAVVAFCALLGGLQILRITRIEGQIEDLTNSISDLKNQREELLRATPVQPAKGGQAELKIIFTQNPPWGEFVSDVSKRLPGTVWLTNFSAAAYKPPVQEEAKDAEKKTKPKKKTDSEDNKKNLALNGQATNISDLTAFVTSLEESPYLANVTLSNSKKEGLGFTFLIECDMVPKQF